MRPDRHADFQRTNSGDIEAEVAFPTGIDDRVAEPHEKAVADISGCQRVVTLRGRS
jgi:hypothetical protein